MKQLTEYTEKTLYGFFKSEEICFVIERNYDEIDESSSITDDLEHAKELANDEEGYQIFVFSKKLARDCFDTDALLEDLIDNLECEGLDREYVFDCMGEVGEKEFIDITTKWFNKIMGDSWIADELLGVLKDES